MVGGLLGPRSCGPGLSAGNLGQWGRVPRVSARDLPPARPWGAPATALSAPAPLIPDLCTELTHIPSLVVATLLPLDSASPGAQSLRAIAVWACPRLGPCFPHAGLADTSHPHWFLTCSCRGPGADL